MSQQLVITLAIYGVPVLVFVGFFLRRRRAHETTSVWALRDNTEAGLTEPASLHPVIDYSRCIGCGNCVAACPEQPQHHVLGIIKGKTQLVSPSDCIGHGACRTACPVNAIELVFGSEKRGVDIPLLDKNFQTTVPGIYIAGELGGMGLIRNAIEQGKQAMQGIVRQNGHNRGDVYDVVVVGAGPAGIAATLTAREHGLRVLTLEQDTLGGTVAHFPRGKLVMTAPVQLPMVGKVKLTDTTKEQLLGFWKDVEAQTGLQINYRERLEDVSGSPGDFLIKTTGGEYRARTILLTIGRRGTPRTLGVQGEELSKVVYRLISPEQYQGRDVLVVGGGDSALEAAAAIADEPGSTVTMSYRSGAFTRAKKRNRERVAAADAEGKIRVIFDSNVARIFPDSVEIEHPSGREQLSNEAVVVCAGGILPTPFLRQIGVHVETKFGSA